MKSNALTQTDQEGSVAWLNGPSLFSLPEKVENSYGC